jgi:hypothetical protein
MSTMSSAVEEIEKYGFASAPLEPDANDSKILHNLFSAPYHNRFVAHYIPRIEYFKSLLRGSKLRFGRTDLQEKDSKDSCYPEANLHSQSTMTRRLNERFKIIEDPNAMIESQNISRRYSYIHCWFGQKEESRGMWCNCGGDGHGVCIQTISSKLLRSIRDTQSHLHIEPAVVDYTNNPITTLFSSAPYFRKDPSFQGEKEFRLLARIKMDHTPKEPGTNFLAEAPEFQLIEVDLKTLLDVVVIGSKVSDEDFIFLKTWIQSLSPLAAVRRSSCE